MRPGMEPVSAARGDPVRGGIPNSNRIQGTMEPRVAPKKITKFRKIKQNEKGRGPVGKRVSGGVGGGVRPAALVPRRAGSWPAGQIRFRIVESNANSCGRKIISRVVPSIERE